ncbi:molecular chaperone [Parablastomonas sp. CN1-191]|uniref:fimbrial biogenesis chaperone n=1 Tax=Parablastomonas sp. CN1-191 TaxID=3400908 RepID=UPI003BF83D23
MNSFLSKAFAAVLLACTQVSAALAMTVQPVVLDLQTQGRGMTQVITVTNTFAAPLAVELRAEQIVMADGTMRPSGKETDDLLIFPPQALIQPGQTQSFRVQYVGDPQLATSKHYYVTVAQLPVKRAEGDASVQVLYNFQVLVSIAPQGGKPAIKVDQAAIVTSDAGKPVVSLTVSNPSNTHGFLSQGRMRIIERDAAGKEIFRRSLAGPEVQQIIGYGLIGAGQTRKVTVPVELPSAAGTLDVQFTPEG